MQNKGVAQCKVSLDVMRLLFDLWFQVLLVRQDVSVPLCDGLILTHPDLLSNLEEKETIISTFGLNFKWNPPHLSYIQPNVKLMNWMINTCWISLKSWLTSIIPPSNSLTASASASMVSISKWLVGSSRNNMWGFCQASQAKHTRHFWPSDKFLIGLTWKIFQM